MLSDIMLYDIWPIVTVIIGLMFTWHGAHGIWKQRRLVRTGERTAGTVVDVRKGYDTRRSFSGSGSFTTTTRVYYRYPVLEFRVRDGGAVRAVTDVSRPFLRVGKTVPVLYDPDDPEVAQIDTFLGRSAFVNWIFCVVGIVLLGVNAYHLF